MSLKDITLGRYIHGDSVLHRLDPRTKLVALLLLSSALFSGRSWPAAGMTAAITVAAVLLSGIHPSHLMKSLLPFKWLVLMTLVLNILFVGGVILIEAPLPYGGITREGLDAGCLYSARILLLVLLASLMTLSTEPILLVDGIEKLIAPLKHIGVKPHEISTAMVITIRFIPIFIDEAEKIRKSYQARGFRDDGITAKLRGMSLLFLPLFHSALRRAETLAIAMDCRMYHCAEHRTRLVTIRMVSLDWMLLGFVLAVALLMFAM